MNKRYLAIGYWADKVTGQPVTRIAEITSGISKNGQPYELVDTDRRETIEGAYPAGTILAATMNLTVQKQPESKKGLKLGTSK